VVTELVEVTAASIASAGSATAMTAQRLYSNPCRKTHYIDYKSAQADPF